MNLKRILSYAKYLIELSTKEGDIVVDATVGNGYDTLFLANLVKETGQVFGFDIQEEAIQNTTNLLNIHQKKNVTLFLKGHEYLKDCIPYTYHGQIASAIFNLGYLPKGGNHSITTKGETTIEAIRQLMQLLKLNGLIVLVLYSGHVEGKQEIIEVMDYVSSLNQKEAQVLMYRFINQAPDAPFIVAIEKIK